uniref:protein phosphatase 1 regulatory subunit 3G n=1 Tax=Pristiophorus japonicus TaxID=55135 RepID=UPI00398E86D5
MEEPEPGISQAVQLDRQQELKGAALPCSSHTLQPSLGTGGSNNCTGSNNNCTGSNCTGSSSNCTGCKGNGTGTNTGSKGNCTSRGCTNSSSKGNCTSSNKRCSNCTNTSSRGNCTGSSKCTSASSHCTHRGTTTSSHCTSRGTSTISSTSRKCASSSCTQVQQPGCKLCCPEKEALLSAVSRHSNELRLNRRRTKSLPCLHDPADFFGDLHGGLRKKVKFADSLGLSLASVKHFRASDQPYVPSKVLLRLQSFPAIVDDLNEKFKALGIHCLRPAFAQPGEASDFWQRAEKNRVCLEKVTVSHFDIHGLVRVLNVSYAKEVTVRYTFNNWLSCLDTPARYVEGSSQSGTDQFAFSLSIPPFLDQGAFVHFAICYRADNEEYWDNNFDKNYALQCESTSDEHANI